MNEPEDDDVTRGVDPNRPATILADAARLGFYLGCHAATRVLGVQENLDFHQQVWALVKRVATGAEALSEDPESVSHKHSPEAFESVREEMLDDRRKDVVTASLIVWAESRFEGPSPIGG